ncbi:uncharacterized protein LOC127721212 isoform X1 [Mytilus californianus]|uniref:uncharacterized protein LOC127721212 isoform X1 n=1 Tax=Mytilus californianus TaxID=6549 RepID=UPI002247322E|nr:uncharacterized protein LOC127721212 isoform X1 [Mytilus californianus]
MSFFNHGILEHYSFKADYNTLNFIRSIWLTLDGFQHTSANIISGHTERDTHNSLSLLLPSIYTCLASNISAVAIQNPNPQIRYFLLLGSFVYFMKGNLPGRLKFISVLYAAELYNDCEWWIDQLDEEYIKYNPSLCKCRYILIDQKLAITDIIKTSPLEVSNCVSFLPTEILIAPDAIKYEIFRYVGIFQNEQEKKDKFGRWQYRAVVDSNIYFFLLKYLIKRKLERVQAREDAKHNIRILAEGLNVRHRDVAFNVLAWIFHSDFDTYTALSYATESWRAMLSAGISHAMSEDTLKMKSKQYQYNAAKIHALVIIYKTWFARIPSDVYFCFQCFCKSDIKLKKCSRCKVSTYCDKQCQRKNWKIHKKTCKMARKHHILFSTSVLPFTFNERIS